MLGSYLLVIVSRENFKWCLNLSSSAVKVIHQVTFAVQRLGTLRSDNGDTNEKLAKNGLRVLRNLLKPIHPVT